jgi:ferredoxin-type protein NapH
MSDNISVLNSLPFDRRTKLHWWYGASVLLVIALGWFNPYIGLFAPVVMATGVIGGIFRGRYVCGNLCPRGSFLDTWMSKVAGRREVPAWMRGQWFRGAVMAGLMGFLGWRIAGNAGSMSHWGHVFWQMCLLTTLAAVGLGLTFRARAWCAVCPMGSLQAVLGGGKYPLQIADNCRDCRVCEQVCPMALPITAYRMGAEVKHPDCIKCSRCESICSAAALSWPQ